METPDQRFRRNLVALAEFQPKLSVLLERITVDDDVQAATGRDGSPTFLLSNPGGRPRWLGDSSMPTVSAEEQFGSFQSQGVSVIVPGILTGREVLVLAERLPKHLAVFVIEPHELHLALAMRLHDYAELLKRGRLILLRGPHLEDDLRDLFARHPGFEMPTQLLNLPQVQPSDAAALQARIERCGSEVVQCQSRELSSVAAGIRDSRDSGCGRRIGDHPNVAVLSTSAAATTGEGVGAIGAALERLSCPATICIPDRPSSCHALARLRAIRGCHADLVLFVDGLPGGFRQLLSAETPVVSWLSPHSVVPGGAGTPVGSYDLFLASSIRQMADLAAAGAPADRIFRIEPGIDDCLLEETPKQPTKGNLRVGIMADLPDSRAEAAGLHLPSHLALWEAVCDAAARSADKLREDSAAVLLQTAQKQCGVNLEEASLRDQLLALIRARIIPACLATHAASWLAEQFKNLAVWGSHWEQHRPAKAIYRGSIPVGSTFPAAMEAIDCLILPIASPRNVQLALGAVAMGVRVAMRAGLAGFEHSHPDLADLNDAFGSFRSTARLSDWMRGAGDAEAMSRAREIIADRHTMTARLRQVLHLVNHGRKKAPDAACTSNERVSADRADRLEVR